MEETMMETTNEAIEEVAGTEGIKSSTCIVLATVIAGGIILGVIATRKLIAKYKAKKDKTEDQDSEKSTSEFEPDYNMDENY